MNRIELDRRLRRLEETVGVNLKESEINYIPQTTKEVLEEFKRTQVFKRILNQGYEIRPLTSGTNKNCTLTFVRKPTEREERRGGKPRHYYYFTIKGKSGKVERGAGIINGGFGPEDTEIFNSSEDRYIPLGPGNVFKKYEPPMTFEDWGEAFEIILAFSLKNDR